MSGVKTSQFNGLQSIGENIDFCSVRQAIFAASTAK
jgi:hypothetical protein